MFNMKDSNKIKIYAVIGGRIYFKYEGVNYMIRQISECGDNFIELTNKITWERLRSDYTFDGIRDFIKAKYGKYKRSTPYAHLDLEHFHKKLQELKLINIK